MTMILVTIYKKKELSFPPFCNGRCDADGVTTLSSCSTLFKFSRAVVGADETCRTSAYVARQMKKKVGSLKEKSPNKTNSSFYSSNILLYIHTSNCADLIRHVRLNVLEGGRCPHMERLDVDLDITQERSEKATCTCEL